jgi:hypothetical protein
MTFERASAAEFWQCDQSIIGLLQFDNNGGPCPFFWQELRVFAASGMAESCRFGGGKNLSGEIYFGIFAKPCRKA